MMTWLGSCHAPPRRPQGYHVVHLGHGLGSRTAGSHHSFRGTGSPTADRRMGPLQADPMCAGPNHQLRPLPDESFVHYLLLVVLVLPYCLDRLDSLCLLDAHSRNAFLILQLNSFNQNRGRKSHSDDGPLGVCVCVCVLMWCVLVCVLTTVVLVSPGTQGSLHFVSLRPSCFPFHAMC